VKRICLAALAALFALGAATTGAHANQGVFGTWWNAKDPGDHGLGFGFRSKVQVAPLFSFDTRVSWIKFKSDDISVYPIEATGMLKLGMIYLGAGGGYYVFDAKKADLDNNFGWYALGGIDISAGPVGVFGEAKWNSLSTHINGVTSSTAPTSLSADGVSFNLGVMFGVQRTSSSHGHRKAHS
jgi:hypothetical protein